MKIPFPPKYVLIARFTDIQGPEKRGSIVDTSTQSVYMSICMNVSCYKHDRHQAIILTNAAILSIRPQGIYFSEICFKIQVFIQETALQNIVCEMVAISFRLSVLNQVRLCLHSTYCSSLFTLNSQ